MKTQARFDDENAPFGASPTMTTPSPKGDAEPELLIVDHEMYRRDDDLLPIWHPAKPAAT